MLCVEHYLYKLHLYIRIGELKVGYIVQNNYDHLLIPHYLGNLYDASSYSAFARHAIGILWYSPFT